MLADTHGEFTKVRVLTCLAYMLILYFDKMIVQKFKIVRIYTRPGHSIPDWPEVPLWLPKVLKDSEMTKPRFQGLSSLRPPGAREEMAGRLKTPGTRLERTQKNEF